MSIADGWPQLDPEQEVWITGLTQFTLVLGYRGMSGDSPTETPTPRRPAPSDSRVKRTEVAATVRAEQQRRWRAGEKVPLENYLSDYPELASDNSLVLDLAYAEFLLAREIGAATDPDAFAARFPAVATQLRQQLEFECALGLDAGATMTAPAGADSTLTRPLLRVPGFEVLEELGRGGMGVVYKARQVRLNRIVALKTLPDRDGSSTSDAVRFLAEAELVAAVKHPNVVAVFEFGQVDGRPYFAMEYLAGGSLRDRLKPGKSLPFREAAVLLARVARAVEAAHDLQVIHRDLKPANILFDGAGEPKVTDFGLARRGTGVGLTATQVVIGTPSYMAPEQAEGKGRFVGPAADVYALGAVLYEAITGSVPFPGDDAMSVLRQVLQDEPIPPAKRNPAVPRDLELVCLKCLHKNPADRYSTASALADDLERFAAGLPVSVRAAGYAERLVKWARRNPRDATLVGTVAVLLVTLAAGSAGAAIWMRQKQKTAEENETRAVIAESDATHRADDLAAAQETLRQELIRSNRALPGEVRAMRLRGQPGQYFVGVERLREALARAKRLGAPATDIHEIRNELLNLLTVTDVDVEAEWEDWPADLVSLSFSSELDRYFFNTTRPPASIREAPGGRVIANLPLDVPPPQYVQFAPGGRRFLLGYDVDPRAELWEIESEIANLVWQAKGANKGVFLDNGSRVAVGAVANGKAEVQIRDGATGTVERQIADAGWVEGGLPNHPSKPWIVVDRGNRLSVVDYETSRLVAYTDRPKDLYRVAWHPTRPILAIASREEIRQWDVTNDKDAIPPLKGHTHGGVFPGFDRSGEMLISSDWSAVLRCWDAATGRQLLTAPRILLTLDFANAPPGRLAAGVEGRRVQLYRFHPGRGLRIASRPDTAKDGFTGAARFSPDGRLLVSRVGDFKCVILDSTTGVELATLPDTWRPAGFLANGELLTSGPRGLFRWPIRYTSGRCRVGPPVWLAPIRTVTEWSASLDGRVLAETRFNDGLALLHLPSGKSVATGPQLDVRAAAVSPDGAWAVAGSYCTAVKSAVSVYDAKTGALVRQLTAGGGMAWFSPDGRSLAVTSMTGNVYVFEVGTWAERWRGDGQACAFAPDGQLLAVGEGRGVIRLRAVADGHEVARLEVPDQTRLLPNCFSPDGGRLVASGFDDRQIYIWDLRHLRAGLEAEGLDWDWPKLPTATDRLTPDRLDVIPYGMVQRMTNEAFRAYRTNDLATASDRIGKLRAIDSDDPEEQALLAILLINGPPTAYDPTAALKYAQKAVAAQPNLGIAQVALGLAQFHCGEYRSAAASIDRGLAIDPKAGYVYVWYTLARARLFMGDIAGALSAGDKTLRAWGRVFGALFDPPAKPAKK